MTVWESVHVSCDPIAVFGTPGLLIAGTSAIIVGERCLGDARIGVVTIEIALIDGPTTKRRDVGVVGACGGFRGPASDEKSSIPAERPFIEISEPRVPTEILVAQPGDEPIEFTSSVRAVVAALTSLALAVYNSVYVALVRIVTS